jgi:hypothetical protein
MTLKDTFDRYGSDKGKIGYGPVYEFYFESLKDKPITLLEMGIWYGASLKSWKDYFSIATIVGIDESHRVTFDDERIFTHVGRQEDSEFLTTLATQYQGFDVVIDDCGHFWQPQQEAFRSLWPHIKSGGFYIIEDLGTSFKPEFKAGPITTVDFLLDFAKNTVADESRNSDIEYVHCYPNQVILRKRCG